MELIRQNSYLKKNCFVEPPIELAVKIRKNTRNFTSDLKPASLVRDEFARIFTTVSITVIFVEHFLVAFYREKNIFRQF